MDSPTGAIDGDLGSYQQAEAYQEKGPVKQNEDLEELMKLAQGGNFTDTYWQLMTDAALAVHDHIQELEEQTEGTYCPIGPISIERFDAGMDEIKRMYALVMAENEVLRQAPTGKAIEKVWHLTCECLPGGAGRLGIVAHHVDGEKRLTVQEIESRLAQLEQARYQIAALETTLLEAGLEIEHPWENDS